MPTVLMLAASPQDQDRLRLGAEFRDIRESLKRSQNRENWTIESNEATTVDDLRRALLDYRPSILHFAGHGSGTDGLCFEDESGSTNLASTASLASLFHHFKDNLKCVVLNACYSANQADAIRNDIDYLVGMRGAVGDRTATKFAVAFYDAVFAGTDYRTAFDLGCTALDLNSLPDADAPMFLAGSHLDIPKLSYTSHVPEVERVLYTYFNTPFRDRAPLTTGGDQLSETIEKHYGELLLRRIDKVQVLGMDQLSDDQWRVLVEVSAASDRRQRVAYVRIRNRCVRVEWEATVGYWSVPAVTYLALGAAEPVVARVSAQLGDYYNYEFADRQHQFQCIKLWTKSRTASLHGYVRRHSEVCRELMAILDDGNEHSLTLEISRVVEQTDMPLIDKLLSKTWLYTPHEAGADK